MPRTPARGTIVSLATSLVLLLPGLAVAALSLASINPGGAAGNGDSTSAAISPDGRFVVFQSGATNLTNDCPAGGVFRRDTVAGTIVCLDPSDSFFSRVSVSGDGNLVAFESFADHPPCLGGIGRSHAYLRDVAAGTTTCLGIVGGQVEDSSSGSPVISADGTTVAFESYSTNLDPACPNGFIQPGGDSVSHVYVYTVATGTLACLTLGAGGQPGDGASGSPAISRDGRFVAFQSRATNLDPACGGLLSAIFLHDRAAGSTACVSVGPAGPAAGDAVNPRLSGDASLVIFGSLAANLDPRCQGNIRRIFVRDTLAGVTRCESVDSLGVALAEHADDGDLSPDGRYALYVSRARDAVCTNRDDHVYRRDRVAGTVRCIDVGPGGPGDSFIIFSRPVISDQGRFVAFEASATTLAAGVPEDVYQIYLAQPAPESTLTVRLNASAFRPGDTLVLEGALTAGSPGPVDAYVLLRLPGGVLFSLTFAGLVPGVVPLATGLTPFDVTQELLRYTFTGLEPVGDFAWLSGLTAAGTLVVVAGAAETPFAFAP